MSIGTIKATASAVEALLSNPNLLENGAKSLESLAQGAAGGASAWDSQTWSSLSHTGDWQSAHRYFQSFEKLVEKFMKAQPQGAQVDGGLTFIVGLAVFSLLVTACAPNSFGNCKDPGGCQKDTTKDDPSTTDTGNFSTSGSLDSTGGSTGGLDSTSTSGMTTEAIDSSSSGEEPLPEPPVPGDWEDLGSFDDCIGNVVDLDYNSSSEIIEGLCTDGIQKVVTGPHSIRFRILETGLLESIGNNSFIFHSGLVPDPEVVTRVWAPANFTPDDPNTDGIVRYESTAAPHLISFTPINFNSSIDSDGGLGEGNFIPENPLAPLLLDSDSLGPIPMVLTQNPLAPGVFREGTLLFRGTEDDVWRAHYTGGYQPVGGAIRQVEDEQHIVIVNQGIGDQNATIGIHRVESVEEFINYNPGKILPQGPDSIIDLGDSNIGQIQETAVNEDASRAVLTNSDGQIVLVNLVDQSTEGPFDFGFASGSIRDIKLSENGDFAYLAVGAEVHTVDLREASPSFMESLHTSSPSGNPLTAMELVNGQLSVSDDSNTLYRTSLSPKSS